MIIGCEGEYCSSQTCTYGNWTKKRCLVETVDATGTPVWVWRTYNVYCGC